MTMDQDTSVPPSDAQKKEWAEELAKAMAEWPYLSGLIVRGGLTHDTKTLQKRSQSDPELNAQLHAVFSSVEAVLRHELNSLASAKDEALAENDALQKRVDSLQTQLIDALSSRPTPGVSVPRRRFNHDPATFHGTSGVAQRQQEYKNWKTAISVAHSMDPTFFSTDIERILHTTSLLAGDALERYRNDVQAYIDQPLSPAAWPYQTVAELFADMDRVYISTNEVLEARTKLDNLVMGNKPFTSFLADFDKWSSRAEKTDAEKVSALRYKVSSELNTMVSNQLDLPALDNYSQWVALFTKTWERIKEKEHIDKIRNNASRPTQAQPAAAAPFAASPSFPPAPTADQGDPMVIDAMRPSRDECQKKGLCFYCKKPGHTKDTCEEKKCNDGKFGRSAARPGHQGQATRPQYLQAQPYGQGQFAGPPRGRFYNFQSYRPPYGNVNQGFSRQPGFYNRAMSETPQGFVESLPSQAESPGSYTPAASIAPSTSASQVDGSKNN